MTKSKPSVADEANAWQAVKAEYPETTRAVLDEIELGARAADALNGGQK
ncbi:hypothetical protein [Streptosporangium jomthongense]|uniref:Uncharacterized protein n=1 Tax=Streptosporangium jomthongense TaxID=1193683 RepID=A0ABV8FCA7_9ACTN